MVKQFPLLLSSIQHLDLQGIDFTSHSTRHFPWHLSKYLLLHSKASEFIDRQVSPLRNFLLRLKNLKTVTFTERSRVGGFIPWPEGITSRELWEKSFVLLLAGSSTF